MAQIVKLRRSAVPGRKPTNAQLELGELSINTSDGKVYFAKSGSLGPSIEELVSTNTVNTGSVNVSGSINLIGQQTITGSLIVTNGVGYINTGLIAENSDLTLTSGSNIYVEDNGIVSASQIWGDGSHLINIPASGVTGLELFKIVSGSVSASISPDRGLEINTNTTIVGSVSASLFSGSGAGLINVPFHITGSDVDGNTYDKQFSKLQFDDSTGLNVSESVSGTAFISIG
jgi:hypothetical protein